MMKNETKKVNYAVVGLGYFAQSAVLPAFLKAKKNSSVTALFSGDASKLKKIGKKYRVPGMYHYDQFEEVLSQGEIDAVYIALPNSMHREYVERAAKLGIHVLCEKPLGVTEQECKSMIAVTEEANVKFMVAYRLHFEYTNLKAVETIRAGKIGEPRIFNSVFTMQVKEGNIRLQKKMGGGTLYDIGIYCINAARYLFREEPTEVFAFSANNGEKRFAEVDEMTSAILRFPNEKLAAFTTSFGAYDVSRFEVIGTKGTVCLDPAYEFAEGLEMEIKTEKTKKTTATKKKSQVAAELLYFSECILQNTMPEPSGVEGLADVRIIEALYESARTGKPVKIKPVEKSKRASLAQEKHVEGHAKPKLYHAKNPHP